MILMNFQFKYLIESCSFSETFNLVLEDSRNSFEVSHAASSSSLALLNFGRPSVFAGASSRVPAGGADAVLLMITHASASSAQSVCLLMSFTE